MMDVIDAKDVKSSGDGLNSGEVGQRSTFYLNLGRDSFPSEIKVNISCKHLVAIVASSSSNILIITDIKY